MQVYNMCVEQTATTAEAIEYIVISVIVYVILQLRLFSPYF